ncbi:hypothetical protein ACF1DY_15220 [Streptomyces albus]
MAASDGILTTRDVRCATELDERLAPPSPTTRKKCTVRRHGPQ